MVATIDQPTPPAKHWTYADVEHLDKTERCEIYDGKLIWMPRSYSVRHQEILSRFAFAVAAFVELHPLGEVVFGPLDVIFSQDNIAQPDVLFIANENASIIKDKIFGAPDLTVEVISEWSIVRDRYEKMEQYARFGVKEYWIVDPANRSVEVLTLHSARYVLHASAVETGTVSSLVLSGFELEVAQIF